MAILSKAKIYDIFTKISNIYNDFYIFKNGYILTNNIEKPFIIKVDDDVVETLYCELATMFNILRVTDNKVFKNKYFKTKKDDEEDDSTDSKCFYVVESKIESIKITDMLEEMTSSINSISNWEKFLLSDNNDDNDKLILSLFKDNNYIEFKPKSDIDVPEIILTKSLLPLVNEKNYTNLYYSTSKKTDELYMMVFDFQFNLFEIFMIHYYVSIK